MTLSAMNKKGYDDTQKEIKQFYSLISKEYKKALSDINKEIRGIYDKVIGNRSYSEIAKILKEQPNWLYVQANKFDRLQSLEKKVQSLYTQSSIKAGNMTVEASKMSIINNFYRQQFSIAFASNTQLSFSVINPYVVEVSVLGTPKVWKEINKKTVDRINKKYGKLDSYQPQYGSLSNILVNGRKKDIRKIQSSITQGLIQGKSYTKIANDVKTVLDGSINQALRVVRTESHRNINAGAYAAHNVGLSEGVKLRREIVSVLDSRTRLQSEEVDNKKEDKNGMFHYPGGALVEFPGNSGNPAWDINDRETVIETIDGESPLKRTGRNPVTGQTEIMDYTDFNTWAKKNGLKRNSTGRLVVT